MLEIRKLYSIKLLRKNSNRKQYQRFTTIAAEILGAADDQLDNEDQSPQRKLFKRITSMRDGKGPKYDTRNELPMYQH